MAARRVKPLHLVTGALAVGLLVFFGVQQAPAVRSSLTTLEHLHWPWLIFVLAAESGSMAALAHSQRQLLHVSGTRLSARSTVAVAYASNALSVSLPLAGASIGTAFSYHQFRRRGIDTATAGWALTVSGVMSSLSFALLMTAGALLTDSPTGATIGLSGAAVSALPVLALLAALRYGRVRRRLNRAMRWVVDHSRRWFDRPHEGAAEALEKILNRAATLRATRRQYTVAFLMSLRNWVADCACLGAAIAATGAHVPFRGLILAYCLAVAAGSFGITPGGVGVVELTLTASLVAIHIPADKALPAVVIYRLVSFWLVMAVGWILVAGLSRGGGHPDAVPDETDSAPASASAAPETSLPLN
jgi:putative heme transporter